MKKKNILRVLVISIALILPIIFSGYCAAADKTFEELKFELKDKGVSDEFIRITENSVRRMLLSGALVVDVESVLLDLWSEGVKGLALKNAVASVAHLVESGDNTLEAAKITSGAAHKAQAEGLGGFGVGMRVKKSVQERKAYLQTLKK